MSGAYAFLALVAGVGFVTAIRKEKEQFLSPDGSDTVGFFCKKSCYIYAKNVKFFQLPIDTGNK